MAFTTCYSESARRHLGAADRLIVGDRSGRAEAGYLYGLAAECVLKKLVGQSGLAHRHSAVDQDDPFRAHFPRLKTLLRDAAHGKHAREWRRYVEDDSFMRAWDIDMRYAPSGEICQDWIDRWQEQARDIVNAMNL
jgi:hypothetical protein